MCYLIEQFLQAHADYTIDIIEKLKKNNITEEDRIRAGRDNLCRVGQWLEKIAPQYGDSTDYRNTCEAHTAFHRNLEKLITDYMNGYRPRALAELEKIQSMDGGGFCSALAPLTRLIRGLDETAAGLF